MDKLKIIKTTVFFLTFCMVFLLCFLITKIIIQCGQEQDFYTIKLDILPSQKEYNLLSDGRRLYISADKKIHIINLSDKIYEGVVILDNGGTENGKK